VRRPYVISPPYPKIGLASLAIASSQISKQFATRRIFAHIPTSNASLSPLKGTHNWLLTRTSRVTMKGYVLLAWLASVELVWTQSTENPICWICSDGGVSTITLPDVLVPLPEFTGYTEATCETIRAAGEDARIIPDYACSLLDREDFRILCGCENSLTTAPAAATVAVPTPVAVPIAAPVAVPVAVPTPTGTFKSTRHIALWTARLLSVLINLYSETKQRRTKIGESHKRTIRLPI
jgi:hypothetical protein